MSHSIKHHNHRRARAKKKHHERRTFKGVSNMRNAPKSFKGSFHLLDHQSRIDMHRQRYEI